MNKIIYLFIAAIATIGIAGSVYYHFTKVEVIGSEAPSSAPFAQRPPTSPEKPKPDHGDFKNRFQPSLPPVDGGKSK